MKERFLKLCTLINVNKKDSKKWWDVINSKYNENHRFYHTISHLNYMFNYYDKFKLKLKNHKLVELSIFFHDIIYDCKHGLDEDNSVLEFLTFSKLTNLTKDQIELVKLYISTTKSHLKCTSKDSDLLYFLDFDLSILGSSELNYTTYSNNVRKEYQGSLKLNDKTFITKRIEFLNQMLTYKSYYFTNEFKILLDDNAKNNMKNEITILNKELI